MITVEADQKDGEDYWCETCGYAYEYLRWEDGDVAYSVGCGGGGGGSVRSLTDLEHFDAEERDDLALWFDYEEWYREVECVLVGMTGRLV